MNTTKLREHLKDATNAHLWGNAMDDFFERWENGYVEYLTLNDLAVIVERSDKILVVFEYIEDILQRSNDCLPTGWEIAEKNDWSYFGIAIHKENASAIQDIFTYFEELEDSGLFPRHSKAVLFGTRKMSGAACMFSAYFSDASVAIIEPPQDLLSVALYGRENSEDSLIGSIPPQALTDAIEAMNALIVALDPLKYSRQNADKEQRAGSFVLNCRHMEAKTEQFIRQLDMLDSIFEEAMSDKPNFQSLYATLRNRRDLRTYLRHILRKTQSAERVGLEILLCQNVISRMQAPHFKSRLKRLLISPASSGAKN